MGKRATGSENFLLGGGMMGKLIARQDWSNHKLGAMADWPQSLKLTLTMCLNSPFPMAIYWGKELFTFYNDSLAPLAGNKHPGALGKPAKEVWSDIWPLISSPTKKALRKGEGTIAKKMLLPVSRSGFVEECYFDYTFNPIFNENSVPVGILNICNEITNTVLNQRRYVTYRHLSGRDIVTESPEATCILIANALSESPEDVPFALIYLLNPDGVSLRLAASSAIDEGTSITKSSIKINARNKLPFKATIDSRQSRHVKNLSKYSLPGGIWDEPCAEAVISPIINPGTKEVLGVSVLGISPRLNFDSDYRQFFEQICEQTAHAVSASLDLRKKLTIEAREQEVKNQLQTALSRGLVGVWSWDISSNKIYADENLAQQFHIDPKKAEKGIDRSIYTNLLHPGDRARVRSEINKAINQTKLFHSEYRILANGNVKWVMARGRVEDDKNGKPIRFPGVAVDITDRKEIESELEHSERMFTALFRSSILGIIVASMEGKIYEANNTFLKMFGYSQRDLKRGLYSHMITPPKSRGVTSTIYAELRKRGEVEPVEKEYQRKDGTILPTLIGAVMIPDSKDRFIAFMLDISEQKQLLALNKAKDEFISIASHQLRTPATGVKQYLGMLLEGYAGNINVNQQQILKTAYNSNERQLTIVNDLLRVAQADAREVKLQRELTDVTKLIHEVLREQALKFNNKGQNVHYDPPSKKAIGLYDPIQLRMVLENIIDNASKYTPNDRDIWIKVTSTSKNVRVRVKDEGVGIRKKDMQKLFKKFSRIENPLSTSAGGTGLGLYWASKIIELHNGSIKVTSAYRKGTEFVITVPIGVT
jgi:PAS domain S-box-containing protein